MEKQYEGMKKAIVVGASSGIGMEVARLLSYPMIHSSAVAELYTPPVFENKKVRWLLVLENKCVPLQKIFIIIGFMTALHALMS